LSTANNAIADILMAIHDLSQPVSVVLGGPTVVQIANETEWSIGYVHRLLNQAVEDGLVEWETDGQGRRISHALRLTDEGLAEVEKCRKAETEAAPI
jgi:DNA-binding MarR family transcriptional regulator